MFRIIKVGFICIWRLIFAYFSWMRKYAKNPSKYPFELRYQKVRKLCIFVLKHFKVDYHLRGIEKISQIEGSFLLICNHLSNLDPVCMIAASEVPLSFLAKAPIKKYPFVGKCMIILEGRFIDHNNLRDAINSVIDIENDFNARPNRHWVIFPEGKRNLDYQHNDLLPFHSGSFRIPFRTKISFVITGHYGPQYVANKKIVYKRTPYIWELVKIYQPSQLVQYHKEALKEESQSLLLEKVIKLKQEEQVLIDNYQKKKKPAV